ncbi:glycosyltransferase family 9 protein [Ferrovibrio sp.]|uniref:glycosyltransferase family 9 protein n=1 Tax=Ferrovibrio sp. TaxID=1917215 RepID=UPI0039190CB7
MADAAARLFSAAGPRNVVLLVRTFGIGDALLFRLLLESYKAALVPPGMRCIILGATDWQPVIADFFAGETVILVDQKRYARRFFYRLRFNVMLRRLGVARAVCPVYRRNPIVADAMVAATGAPERWVMEPEVPPKMQVVAEYFRSGMTRIVDCSAEAPKHEIQRQRDFIDALALPAHTSNDSRVGLKDLLMPLDDVGDAAGAILINLGASYGPRRWPLENWFEVAAALAAEGRRVRLVGGPAERDMLSAVLAWHLAQAEFIRRHIEVAIGAWSFTELVSQILKASLVLSSDTGPAHLAALLGVRVIVVLGGGHFGEFFPYPGQQAWAHVAALWHRRDCYHCSWDCPYISESTRTYPCITDVTVADMIAATRRALVAPLHNT